MGASLTRSCGRTRSRTMLSKVLCCCALLVSAAYGQAFPGANPTYNGDPSLARIVQEQRFNVGNEKFGHAAEQEDGVNGFRIIGGDHIPSGGQNAAAAVLTDDKG